MGVLQNEIFSLKAAGSKSCPLAHVRLERFDYNQCSGECAGGE